MTFPFGIEFVVAIIYLKLIHVPHFSNSEARFFKVFQRLGDSYRIVEVFLAGRNVRLEADVTGEHDACPTDYCITIR